MAEVRKINTPNAETDDFAPSEMYLMVLTQDEIATVCKAAMYWNVDKPKALELAINGGMIILREVLPPPGLRHTPEIH